MTKIDVYMEQVSKGLEEARVALGEAITIFEGLPEDVKEQINEEYKKMREKYD